VFSQLTDNAALHLKTFLPPFPATQQAVMAHRILGFSGIRILCLVKKRNTALKMDRCRYGATISNGTAGSVAAGARRKFAPGFALAGFAAASAETVTIRFPFRPGFTLAASLCNTISAPSLEGDTLFTVIPSGGSLSSKCS
jgi:hypothetical protein